MTYRKEQIRMTLFLDNVILLCTGKNNSNDVVSRQRYSMTNRKRQNRMTLYPDNGIIWRTGKNNSNNVVSRRRYTMTYRKQQNRKTLFPDNGIVWRTGKKKLEWRCIWTTLCYDVPEKINSNDAVSRQRYTCVYRKEQLE